MCGIVGIFDWSGKDVRGIAEVMIRTLRHRGPDDEKVESFGSGKPPSVALGHARLSIIDLTKAASQPMRFKHLTVVFNGEIYNHAEIRKALSARGHLFQTSSDTEVILHSFAEWGVAAVSRFIGMFAFCIYDSHANKAYLVRDRVGVKPLYFYEGSKVWLFASELKAFHAASNFKAEIEPSKVFNFFSTGVIGGNGCIFKGCLQVGAGEIWTLDLSKKSVSKAKYWDAEEFFLHPQSNFTFDESVSKLQELLNSACGYRLVADVPVGVFLSGGYDSTAVAAVLQANSSTALKTFTIGFQFGNDEAPNAKRIADYLGTDHTEAYCTEKEALAIIPELPYIYDEPFSDSSAIPTVLVSRLARRHVKVALSADGGDELFGGYNSYQKLLRTKAFLCRFPRFAHSLARVAARAVSKLLEGRSVRMAHLARLYSGAESRSPDIWGQRLHAQSSQLPAYYMTQMFSRDFRSHLGVSQEQFWGWDRLPMMEGALLFDYLNYLKDDVLVKVDRATMSAGLEGREPLLDHRLFEFAAQLPIAYKVNVKQGKRILKALVHRYIPVELMDRPKTGFSVPINHWLRGPLADFLADFCNEAALEESGVFDSHFLTKQIGLFRKNELYYSTLIWRLLMFQCWIKRWGSAYYG